MQTVDDAQKEFWAALRSGDLDGVRRAAARGARADARQGSLENKTALHMAAARGTPESIRLLVELGADVNARDSAGETPLSMAAFRGRADVVRALLAAHAQPETRSKAGWTPLMAAASEGHTEVVKLLLQAGASPDAKAAELAARYGHPETAAAIRSR